MIDWKELSRQREQRAAIIAERIRTGYDLTEPVVNAIKSNLLAYLASNGYTFRQDYGMNTVGYSQTEVPFREEPILVDDGGMYGENGRPMLKISVRNSSKNTTLVDKVLEILSSQGLTDQKFKLWNETKVFELRRI